MNKFDVTKAPKSIAAQVEPLISKMEGLLYEDLKNQFLTIVNDPLTSASEEVRNKWNNIAFKAKNKVMLMKSITNLYLAGARLSV